MFAFSLTENGINRLVKTACKAFALTGDEKCGVRGDIQTYLAETDKTKQVISIRGHRFNQLFYVAGTIFHHKYETKCTLHVSAHLVCLTSLSQGLAGD